MTRSVVELTREGLLNSIIRNKKNEDFRVLYYSKWDSRSTELLEYVNSEWMSKDGDETLYIASSWDLPHSFVAFKVTQVPCLVRSIKGRILKEDYFPRVQKFFKSHPLDRKNQGS